MSKFKTDFTLKQHTPIIHFQSGQSGATLRATELKSKFDRFLLENVADIPFIENANGHRSLDYKVKISNLSNPQTFKYQTYIAQKDRGNKHLKEGSYFGDSESLKIDKIKIEFFSYKTELIEKIKDNFDEFISINSFGTRSNKGFGNFTNISTTKQEYERYLEKHFLIIKTISNKEPLKKVLSTYQNIKSGGRGAAKSKLMEYFLSNDIRWEKRWIKKQLKDKKPKWFDDLKDEYHINNDFNFQEDEQYVFSRALLGLAEHNEFLVNSSKINKLIVKISNPDIERFQSPINIAIFENNIYFLLYRTEIINLNICNKTFNFTAYYKNAKNTTCNLGQLTTPENFNIEAFLREVLK